MKNGWKIGQLGLVAAINYGYTESAATEPVGPRFLRITDIQNDQVRWESVPYCNIDPGNLAKYRLESGDIVFARTGATTGKSFLVNEPPNAVFASYLIRLRLLDKSLLPKFVSLFFQTESYWRSIKDGSVGSAQGGFNATKLACLSIPIPPLPEQQRIVSIFDEAFEGIATAKANTEKNLQNARALFENHLYSVFTQRGTDWVERPLGQVCDLLNGFAFRSEDAVQDSSTQLVRMGNLYGNLLNLDRSPVFYPDSFASKFERYLLKEGDLILSLTGTTGKEDYGYAVRIPDCDHALLMNQRVAKFELINGEILDQTFLLYYLRSRAFLDLLYPTANGTRQANLSSVTIKTLPVPICSLERQKSIASALNVAANETQLLESIYQRKLAALESLKKSLLHQAFAGQL